MAGKAGRCAVSWRAAWNACVKAGVRRQIEGKNMMRGCTTCVVAIALAAVIACGGKKQEDQPNTVKAEDMAKGSGDAPKRAALTPKSLSPVLIHELGAENVVPTAIVIELGAPIVDRDTVGSPSPATNLKLTPEIAGRLIHTGISELTFTPSRPF